MTDAVPAKRAGKASFVLPFRLPDVWELDGDLAKAVSVILDPFEDVDVFGEMQRQPRVRPGLTLDDQQRARSALESYRQALAQPDVTPETLLVWLAPIAPGVRNPPTDEHLRHFVRSLAFALGETPISVLCEETQREGMRRWQFFPSVAEVMALIEPIRDGWRRNFEGLGLLVADLETREAWRKYRGQQGGPQ